MIRRLRAEIVAVQQAMRQTALWALRLSGAATAAYLVADAILPESRPLLAPLTALLIVQATLFGTLADSVRRVASVLAGVALALVFSRFVGFSWWSLALLVAASILIGVVLRLGPHLLEVPISAMLILSVGSAGSAADVRIRETLVGAAVGALINVLLPPALQTQTAGTAVEKFTGDLGRLLERVARDLQRRVTAEDARSWLDESRRLTQELEGLDDLVDRAVESRRLNPRAVGTLDVGTDLHESVDALEYTALSVRTLFRALVDRLRDQPADSQFYEEDVRQAFAVLVDDLAQAVRAFGALVRVEADEDGIPHPEELTQALAAVSEARVRLTELLLVDPKEQPQVWALHGALLASIERILRELDVQERVRERERIGVQSRAARLREQSVDALRSAVDQVSEVTRQVAEATRQPRRWQRRRRPPTI
ncbi:MAG TPA: aromatic acid exporter family protein [Jatrophihabitantaceae bacterium]